MGAAWPWIATVGAVVLLAGAAAVRVVTGWYRGQPRELRLVSIAPGFELEEAAARAWALLVRAAAADGVSLEINSAFRTMEKQEQLYADYISGRSKYVAAQPGFSNHQAGRAVDVETAGGTNMAFEWLAVNADKFNFKRTVPSEPHHWEYVA